MRFGVFLSPFHRPDQDPTLALSRDLDLIARLDRLGYDEVWIGEHHSGGWETIASPELLIAAAAERTRRIRLGTGVVSLPYHHPFMVAQRIVLLDHLTRGRVMFGVGSGSLAQDARMLGIPPSERPARFAEALEAVTALLRCDGPVSRKAAGFVLDQAMLNLRPYTRPNPPLYLASSFSGAGLAHAARLGAGLLLLGVGAQSGGRFVQAEREAMGNGGRIDRSRLLLVMNVHVAQRRQAALDAIREGATAEQFEYWSGVVGMPQPAWQRNEQVERMLEGGHLVAGSPGECVDQLRHMIGGFGTIGGILVAAREWAFPEETRRSYELFVGEVAPALVEGRNRDAAHDGEHDGRRGLAGLG